MQLLWVAMAALIAIMLDQLSKLIIFHWLNSASPPSCQYCHPIFSL